MRFPYKTHYTGSRALVIGIDTYTEAPPLSYAVNDATGIARLLCEEMDFPKENVVLITNEEATKEKILHQYLYYSREDIDVDDRIVVFFAGHGHTKSGWRGEIGYLVPHDGNVSDVNTLIRWDDLTKNSELVRAKHLLFIMDACYGGLALTRQIQAGSTRFLKDMMMRYSRQVLTAGKADEVVADSGGPVAGHSVFTGHLIEALQGKAASEDGIITANGVMAHVYKRVATDKNSRQTPHYGYFDGDADFIFKAPNLDELEASEVIDLDRLITIPYPEAPVDPDTLSNKILRIKKLIPNDTSSIELHDLLVSELRRFLAETSDDAFPLSSGFTDEELHQRLESYEDSSQVLVALLACLNYWARPAHHTTISKILSRSVDRLESQAGKDVWLELRWYPLLLIMYSAGISAVAGRRYDALATVLQAPVPDSRSTNKMVPLVCRIGDSILALDRMDVFKRIPSHRNNYAPRSEYLFKTLQPILDETLYIGKEYESSFDRFEILLALEVADSRYEEDRSAWGPVGRFGWKNRMPGSGPLASVIAEGVAQGEDWPPIQAGLFRKDPERFKMVAESFNQQVSRLAWY